MVLLAFAARHLLRHWRLNLFILFFLTLASGLVAGLPAYAEAIAVRSLRQTMDDANPSERNIQIDAPAFRASALNTATYGDIRTAFGDLILERVEVRDVQRSVDRLLGSGAASGKKRPSSVKLWAFDTLPHLVQVVEGRLPQHVPPKTQNAMFQPPAIEVVIGLPASRRTNLTVGDKLFDRSNYEMEIVGIVTPVDAQADVWWKLEAPFDFRIPFLGDEDVFTLPVIAPLTSVRDYYRDHHVAWRVLLDHAQVTAENAEAVASGLSALETRLKPRNLAVTTGLPEMIDHYHSELASARMPLFLLTAQAFIFVLYTLAMMTSFLVDQSQGDLVTLAERGAGRGPIVAVFGLEFLALALPAALLFGPALAMGALRLWASTTGSLLPAGLPPESYVLALAAAGLGWLALVIPVLTARIKLLDWQRQVARPAQRAGWQKLYLDLFLLAFGSLAYWQLTEAGSFIMRTTNNARLADPILLLGPSLLLVAVALIFLRLFPYLLKFVSLLTTQARGLIVPLGVARLARDPKGPSRVVLLMSLAAGLILFANVFVNSLTVRQAAISHYQAGADLRISLLETSLDAVTGQLGVRTASRVIRTGLRTPGQGRMDLLAVDPATFPQVARYPPGISNLTIPFILGALEAQDDPGVLPAIFSAEAMPKGMEIGDRGEFYLSGYALDIEVRGTIINFPTMSGDYAVVSLPALEKMVDLGPLREASIGEVWLTVEPEKHGIIANKPYIVGSVLADAQARLRSLQANALSQGATGAFKLNALVLSVLSIAAFGLVTYFSARRRTYEFSILRAAGTSPRQLLLLLVAEGALVMLLGLAAGTAIGYGLARIMVGYLSPVLSAATAGGGIPDILVDWPGIALQYAFLLGCYLLALAGLLLVLLRVGVHRVLRMGEE